MKISTNKAELLQLDACKDGLAKFFEAHGDKETLFSQCLASNSLNDVLWFIEEVAGQFSDSQKTDLHRFACDCALLNIELIKPHCSENEYGLIVSYLNNPTDELADAAERAAWVAERVAERAAKAASAAARAAWVAAMAAASAAWVAASAAWVAASAAWVAASAAAMAARAAVWAARKEAAMAARAASAEDFNTNSEEKVTALLLDVFKKWEVGL